MDEKWIAKDEQENKGLNLISIEVHICLKCKVTDIQDDSQKVW